MTTHTRPSVYPSPDAEPGTGTRRWLADDGGRVDLICLSATEGRDGWWFRYTKPANRHGERMFGGMCRTPDGLPALGVDLATLTEDDHR